MSFSQVGCGRRRGGEHPRQCRYGAQSDRCAAARDIRSPCRAGHRPQALSRAVRGLRKRRAAARRRFARSRDGSTSTISTTRRKTRCSLPPAATASPGASIARTPSSAKLVGNAMNMGTTLAVYASICKATGRPFRFPGSETQWNSLTDMTDAKLLARQLLWASDHACTPPIRISTSSMVTSSAGNGCGAASRAGSASRP